MEAAREGDYILLKWKLVMLISDSFKSKRELGQFLQGFRITNPNHPLCTIKSSSFYRYARAAKFCEKFKIYDLKEMGISPTVIYDLSEKTNEAVVDYKFISNIKNKNLPVSEIKLLIYQAHSIAGELIPIPRRSSKKPEICLPAQDFEQLDAVDNETSAICDVIEEHVIVHPKQSVSPPVPIHVEPTKQMTEVDVAQAVMNLLDSLNIQPNGNSTTGFIQTETGYIKVSHIQYGEPLMVTVVSRIAWFPSNQAVRTETVDT